MRRVARPGPILALLCAAGAVALLVFGVLRAAPDRSIDQAIADGRPLPAPAMRAWRAHRREGVLMLGIDVQDLTGDARAFLAEHRIDFPVVRDPGGDQLRRYGITALPETFGVDARGRVVDHVVGVATDARLRAALRAARA